MPKNINDMKKIKTNLPGLDPLLHGGLQIDSLTGSGSPGDSLSSIVIVLRGKKDVSKHLFAMQLMHGIARSLGKRHPEKEPTAFYYSINKSSESLNDSYIDFIIADWLTFMTRQSRKEALDFGPFESANTVRNDKRMIYEILFDSELKRVSSYEALNSDRRSMLTKYDNLVIDFISDNILTYNPRTNALHFRRPYMGDGPRNLWTVRNCDSIKDYFDKFKNKLNALKSGGKIAQYFKEMFINVVFNGHLDEALASDHDSMYGDIRNMEKYSKTAHVIYDDIVDHMERVLAGEDSKEKLNKKWSQFESYSSEGKSLEEELSEDNFVPMHDVLVIDGFSQLDNEHLKNLQFSHLHKIARRMARVTILVLDDREEALCDGDVVIELRKNEDTKQEYVYHELQIVKSSFQDVANGWHQYKVQSDGIKVFPSIHFLLSKRYYLKSRTCEIGQGMLEDSFEEYLDSMLHKANYNPCEKLDVEGFLYQEYIDSKDSYHRDRFMRMLENHRHWDRLITVDKSGSPDNITGLKILGRQLVKVLIGDSVLSSCERKTCGGCSPLSPSGRSQIGLCEKCGRPDNNSNTSWLIEDPSEESVKQEGEIYGWNKRYPTTVIVGNPNSFKRRMALGKVYHWARRKEHVLIVLFGKNDDTLRRQLICPALQRAACAIKKEGDDKIFGKQIYPVCSECEKYIHFFRIRMGCITAEEIFSWLEEQIRIYSNEDPETGIERSRLHILIDDLQRVDFGFPFLGNTSLFTGALINLCLEHKAELTILCDKHSSRTKEVCALADNVVVMDRKKNDLNNVIMYVEKCVDFPAPGAIMCIDISDVLNLFQCSCIGKTYDKTSDQKRVEGKDVDGKGNQREDVIANQGHSDNNPVVKNDEVNNSGQGGNTPNEGNSVNNPEETSSGIHTNPKECSQQGIALATSMVLPGLSIDFTFIKSLSLIGSMREFWRNTINQVAKKDPSDNNDNNQMNTSQNDN